MNERTIRAHAVRMTSLLGEHDLYLFNEGSHLRLYEKLGAHPGTVDGVAGHPLRRLGAERRARRA